MSPSRRLLRYMLEYRRAFAIGFACVVVTAAIGLTGPWVLKNAIDDLGQGADAAKIRFYAAAIVGLVITHSGTRVPCQKYRRQPSRHTTAGPSA